MHMRGLYVAGLAAVLLGLVSTPAQAQRLSLDVMTGNGYNVPTPLTIDQAGFPEIRFTAHWDTKPLGPYAPYYTYRFAIWNEKHTAAWELQQVHHRVFLTNTTADVPFFAIHFGYNYILGGRAWTVHGCVLHTDAGLVVTSPQNTVRGLSINSGLGSVHTGYNLAGVGGQVALSRQLELVPHLHVIAEGAVMMGHANVPVVGGTGHVPNISGHVRVGFGVSF
jgi:hypothetical protein